MKLWSLVWVCCLIFASEASASYVEISASKDATIFADNTGNSNGGAQGIYVGNNNQSRQRRGLIEFDIAGNIPAGSVITNVQLVLTLGQVAGNVSMGYDGQSRTIELHRLTADWSEGNNGLTPQGNPNPIGDMFGSGTAAPVNSGDATWNFPWAAGGAYAATVSASQSVGLLATVGSSYTWTSATLVSDVQGWLNSDATNHGWILINTSESSAKTFRAFYSSEASFGQPTLLVTFVPEPTSASLAILSAVCFGMRRRLRCRLG